MSLKVRVITPDKVVWDAPGRRSSSYQVVRANLGILT